MRLSKKEAQAIADLAPDEDNGGNMTVGVVEVRESSDLGYLELTRVIMDHGRVRQKFRIRPNGRYDKIEEGKE